MPSATTTTGEHEPLNQEGEQGDTLLRLGDNALKSPD